MQEARKHMKEAPMMKAIRFYEHGEPEVLKLEELERPQPGPGEVLIKVEAVGVNYSDVARRRGIYPQPTALPYIPGTEVAGRVIALGAGVVAMEVGAQVVSLARNGGGYAEYVTLPAALLMPIPQNLDAVHAAAIPLQGLTAYHLLKTSGRLQPGESVLIHAAAGGVGTLAVQLAKVLGAGLVIATASTQTKLDLAQSLGADIGINYTKEGWSQQVREATGGKGVDIILEMVGGTIFEENFTCLAPFGRVIVFGSASGQESALSLLEVGLQLFSQSQSLVGFNVGNIIARPDMMEPTMTALFDYIGSGRVKLQVNHVFPLAEAVAVHHMMQGRQTTGKVVLQP
jgi:NADPH2:quinone reductase